MSDDALSRAFNVIGGKTKLARKLNISPAAVYQWDRVPPLRVIEVERLTGISRHDLRPDLHPRPAPSPEPEGQAA